MECMKWEAPMEFAAVHDIATIEGKPAILRITGLASMTARTDTVFLCLMNHGTTSLLNGEGRRVKTAIQSEFTLIWKAFAEEPNFRGELHFRDLWTKAQKYVAPRSPIRGMRTASTPAPGIVVTPDLGAVLGRALGESIMPQVEARIERAMESVEERVKAVLAEAKVSPVVVRVEGMKDVVLDGTEHSRFLDLVRIIPALPANSRNVLLYGEAGSGKSYAAKQYAERIGLPYSAVSFSAGVSESMFCGRYLPAAGGMFEWKPTPFTNLYATGGVFCLDELDKADPQVATALNMALANGEIVTTEGRVLQRHKDFVAIAGANSLQFSKVYAAAQPQDGSLLNRFFKLEWQLCPQLLRSVLIAMAGVDHAARIFRIREAVNGLLAEKRCTDWSVGMRVCERMAAMAHAGIDPVDGCLRDEVQAMATQYAGDVVRVARGA